MSQIGLNWKDEDRDLYLSTIPTQQLAPLSKPYPLTYTWIAESQEVYELWAEYIQSGPKADTRLTTRPLELLTPQQLQLTIEADESLVLRNKNTNKLVMVVLRNFTNHPSLLQEINRIIELSVQHRKSVRVSEFVATHISYSKLDPSWMILARSFKLAFLQALARNLQFPG